MDVREEKRVATLRDLLRQLDEKGVTGYPRYAEIKRFITFKARSKGVPVAGTFELTPLCNLDCRMCYVHLNKAQMRGAEPLTVEVWRDLMQQAIDAGMMYATLTGGECLAYPGFRDLYLFLQSKGIEVSILTNGVLIDGEWIAFFKKHPPAMIQITLYGADEEGYEAVTGHRKYETVTANLRALKEAGLPVTVAVTPCEYTADAEKIVRFIVENHYPSVINSGLHAPREETGRTACDASLDVYVAIRRLMKELGGEKVETVEPDEDLPDVGGCGEKKFGVLCGAGRSGFSLSWRGRMKPCNNFPIEGESAIELGFAEAWKRVNGIANNFPLPEECSGCRYDAICKHCVCEHAAGAPIGHASPSVCAYVKRFVSEGLLTLSE